MRRPGYLITALVLIIIIAAVAVGLAHKSKPTAPTSQTQQTTSSTHNQVAGGSINIRDMMFTPSQITVQKGATVTWTNNDTTTHTVVDDLNNVGGPSSGDIAPGQTYSFTFNKTGSFQYHCSIHPSMRGTIVVK